MSLTALKALALAKKYTKDTIEGAGAVAGKPCQIQSITDITGGKRVTFLWVDNSDVEHTSTMDVKDGEDGKGIKTVTVNANNHLVITYTDDTTYDAGEVKITAKVNSVNGKTGDVTLSTSDLNNDSDFVSDSNYVHTDNNYNNLAKALVDGIPTALAEKADADEVIDGASYDSTNHLILFKNGTTTLFSLDAAAFVKDGMVDTVTITGGNLVITFNTDAGKQAISIPITDIFDPANYYDKTATDNLLADKADKVASATNGNFAGLDANGNLTDSGKKASDFGTADEISDIVNVYGAKNLMETTASSHTQNGITKTVNADGSFTLNGTATNNTYFYWTRQTEFPTENIQYTYSIETSAVWGIGNAIAGIDKRSETAYIDRYKSIYADGTTHIEGTFTGESGYYAWAWIFIPNGTQLTDVIVKGMIRLASVKDDTYVPYAPTNAKLNEEKMSYADNGVLGAKNLLNNYATTKTINNVAFTVNSDDKTVNVTRTAEQTEIATRDLYVVSDEDYKLLAGKTLLMTGCPSGGSNDTYYLECYYNDGTGHWLRDVGDGLKITLPATKPTTIKFLIGIKVASVIPSGGLTFKPMLRLASDPDDTYQPYAMTNRELTRDMMYSTSEINTGKKWIDGKTICRKVVDCGNLPNATTKDVAHGITGIDTVVSIYGMATNSSLNTHFPLPYPNTDSTNSVVILVIGANIHIVDAYNFSGYTAKVVLEYTKS